MFPSLNIKFKLHPLPKQNKTKHAHTHTQKGQNSFIPEQ